MPLAEIDQDLLQRTLARKPRSWRDFVDRFLGLILHVVDHTAGNCSAPLTAPQRDWLCEEVFRAVRAEDFQLLRHFRGRSSLATYLTVVGRRIVADALRAMREAPAVS